MASDVGTAHSAVPTSIFRGRHRATTLALLIIVTLVAFEAMAVNAALPTAARDLDGLEYYGFAFTGFLVANIVGLVVSGQLADVRGTRLPLIAGLVCFTAGLVLSGTATSMAPFVAGRVVQGFGGGLLVTALYVLVGEGYPESLQPKVFVATSSAWVLPALLGPVVSGGITEHVSWRLVFLGLAPLVLAGALFLVPALRSMTGVPDAVGFGDRQRIVRALAIAAGIGVVQYAGQHRTPLWIALGGVGLVVLVWALGGLLPKGIVRLRAGIAAPIALRGLLAGAFFGVEASVPLAMSVQHGYTPIAAALPLAGGGVAWSLGSWWQGRASSRPEGARRVALLRTGFLLVGVADLAFAVLAHPDVPGWLAYATWPVGGLGMGLAMTSTSVLLLRATTDDARGADSAALQLADATGNSLATAFGGVLVGAAVAGALAFTTGFVVLGVTLAGLAGFGALVAGRAGSDA